MLQIVATEVLTTPLFLFHVAVLSVSLALFAFAGRNRDTVPSRWFAAWLAVNSAWVGAHTTGLATISPALRGVLDSLELTLIVGGAGTWLLFTFAYSGRWSGDGTLAVRGVAAVTVAVALLPLTNPIHGLVFEWGGIAVQNGVVSAEGGQTQLVPLLLGYVFVLYATGIAVLLDLTTSTERLYSDQIVGLVVAVGVPLLVAAALMTGVLDAAVDPTPTSYGLSAVLLTYVVFRSEVLQAIPAKYTVGERTALASLDQGVLVRDRHDRVVFANETARELLDADGDALLGRCLSEVLARSPLESTVSWIDDGAAQRTDGAGSADVASSDGVPETLRDTRTGRIYRTFESRSGSDGPPLSARTLVLEDVTEERRRKQRLLVLNRIVRHNLRNEMTVLHGYVDALAGEVDDDESVGVVEDIATDLVHLGEKAHEMDRVIREARSTDDPVNVATVVDRVVEEFRAESDATIEVWGAIQAWTHTDVELLETIVTNLLEVATAPDPDATPDADLGPSDPYRADESTARAALDPSGDGGERSGADERQAAAGQAAIVTITTEGDTVTVAVENEGPGLPQAEVESLLDGEVSALRHGASIGLWVVKWCVELADATWEIETGDWTRVSVTFRGEPELQTTATGLSGTE